MFEHRPINQKLLIRRIYRFPEKTIVKAQSVLRFCIGKYTMPFWLPSLEKLLEVCEAIDKGNLKEWKEKENLRAENYFHNERK